jgi:hypothetical protein
LVARECVTCYFCEIAKSLSEQNRTAWEMNVGEVYINRRKETYYLHEGTTKTGKKRYYCSRKPAGATVESMPAGYQWRENPADGIVTVRKIRPHRIAPFERELLEEAIAKLARLEVFIVDSSDDSLTVYLPDSDQAQTARLLDLLLGVGRANAQQVKEWTIENSRYSPMLRFTLLDENERLFGLERWCFRGSIDDWIHLAGPRSLKALADEYVRHLGNESFYDLI